MINICDVRSGVTSTRSSQKQIDFIGQNEKQRKWAIPGNSHIPSVIWRVPVGYFEKNIIENSLSPFQIFNPHDNEK